MCKLLGKLLLRASLLSCYLISLFLVVQPIDAQAANACLKLVKDINPVGSDAIRSLAVLNGALYFIADDGSHGPALWKSDGSATGTVMIKSLADSSRLVTHFSEIVPVNNGLYFSVMTDSYDTVDTIKLRHVELWASDGSAEKTLLLKTFQRANFELPRGYTYANGLVYFSAYEPKTGRELWQTDGTPDRVYIVKDIPIFDERGNALGLNPRYLTYFNKFLYFIGDDPTDGAHIWRTDNVAIADSIVRAVDIDQDSAKIKWLRVDHGALYFVKNSRLSLPYGLPAGVDTLWRTDGTRENTIRQFSSHLPVHEQPFVHYHGAIYFATLNVAWRYNGIQEVTLPADGLSDNIEPVINPDAMDIVHYYSAYEGDIGKLTRLNNNLYYLNGFGGAPGFWRPPSLWKSGGRAETTEKVKDLPGPAKSRQYIKIGNRLFITVQRPDNISAMLWTSDGTVTGTVALEVIPSPWWLTKFNDTIYLIANFDSRGGELWKIKKRCLSGDGW